MHRIALATSTALMMALAAAGHARAQDQGAATGVEGGAGVGITGDDHFQLSFEPFAPFDFGPAFAFARFTMNIDEPGGFAFDDDGIFGFHVGGGANL